MAFNIIAETNKKLNFEKLHALIYADDINIEFIPMSNLGVNGGDAIGICIPLKNANEETWAQLKPILKKLKSEFSCDIYDLYGGEKLGLFNINLFKKNFIGK